MQHASEGLQRSVAFLVEFAIVEKFVQTCLFPGEDHALQSLENYFTCE